MAKSKPDAVVSAATSNVNGEICSCPTCGSKRIAYLDYSVEKKPIQPGNFISYACGCKACGLAFVHPLPSKEHLQAYYAEDGKWAQKKVNDDVIKGHEVEAATDGIPDVVHSLREFRGLPENPAECRVLDFGCGHAKLLSRFKNLGWQSFGIDPATAPLLRESGFVMLDEMPPEQTFHLVIMKHVLEHVTDPLHLLREAHACLLDRGCLLIGMPTLDGLEIHRQRTYCLNRKQHLTAYTERSAASLLAKAGFSVIKVYRRRQNHRMLMVAGRETSPMHVASISAPLRDAQTAFRRYAAATSPGGNLVNLIPVRLRGAIANFKKHKDKHRELAAKALNRQMNEKSLGKQGT